MKNLKITTVSPEDAEELRNIYAPYVANTAISFEYEVPSVDEFKDRIIHSLQKYPYIKAVDENNQIVGYAYAGSFKGRKAYNWSVETTVYVKEEERRNGAGRLLYAELERRLQKMGILNMNACIAVPKGEDAHLSKDSLFFHEKMGFSLVGTFHDSGYKFDTWYDMVWMEKMIGEHTKNQQPVNFGNEKGENV